MFNHHQYEIHSPNELRHFLTISIAKLKRASKKIPTSLWLFTWLLFPSLAQAQVTADGTVGTLVNGSLAPCAGTICTITGGTTDSTGTNLFHSFESFSVDTQAYFNNTAAIQNIISRVTGNSPSTIDGIISANGSANLFLINPNGIIFTGNAKLNIGGSFLATTANSMKFADGNEFSASNPVTPPLLTMSVPIGLQFGQNPAAISVQGTGHNFSHSEIPPLPTVRIPSTTGLQVSPGKTLALVGGDINLEGGVVTAPGGRIELGSVNNGLVSLNSTAQGWTLGYSSGQSFRDIRLSRMSAVDASGNSGGAIAIQARNVIIKDGSNIIIQNLGIQPSGNLTVKASASVQIIGIAPNLKVRSALVTETLGTGSSGNIEVNAPQLLIQNGASLNTASFSSAKSGDLGLNISDSIQVTGFSPLNPIYFSTLVATAYSSGNTGNIAISTKQLTALNGGTLGAITYSTGHGGDFILNADESVKLMGISPIIFHPSTIGNATFNAGNAGNLIINTSKLIMGNGSLVNANTFSSGNAGSVTINAKDAVELSGRLPGTGFPDSISSSATIASIPAQKLFGLPPVPSGSSGDVTINTSRLSISDWATVTALNQGLGKAGAVRINADTIFLDSQGSITTATVSGEGGNIILQAQNFLLMRHNSLISATAGGTGNGGNITINSPFVVAVAAENSDIIANAFQGRGGSIKIATFGIYGLQFRPLLTSKSDITASSDFGVNGNVQINTPGIDASQGLNTLPTGLANVERVQDSCQDNTQNHPNSFIVNGRGGLPPSPEETLSGDTLLVNWAALAQNPVGEADTLTSRTTINLQNSPLIEAQGWVVNSAGQIVLTSQTPNTTPKHSGQNFLTCNSLPQRTTQ